MESKVMGMDMNFLLPHSPEEGGWGGGCGLLGAKGKGMGGRGEGGP